MKTKNLINPAWTSRVLQGFVDFTQHHERYGLYSVEVTVGCEGPCVQTQFVKCKTSMWGWKEESRQ